jgi:hypothetical protein
MLEMKPVRMHDPVHGRIAGGPELFCSWPWTGGIHNFGDGEVVIAYTEKPCAYQTIEDVENGEGEARLVLCRTLDGGQTWPAELRQTVRDNRDPWDAWITQGGEPQRVDMSGRDAMFLFWRSFVRDPWLTRDGQLSYRPVTYAMRSSDRGYHWHMPAVVVPHYHLDSIYGGTKYVKMPNGSILAAFGGYPHAPGSGRPVDAQTLTSASRAAQDESERRPLRATLYISEDQGLHWYFLSWIAVEENDMMGCGYAAPLLLPSGRLMCSVGYRFDRGGIGVASWTKVTYSDDGGWTWTEPRRINKLGDQASLCRLSDGRIVCIYGYRYVPYGVRGIVSEDQGRSWSQEFVIRADGAGPDLGYPVVTELPDGRILVVYYFNVADDTDYRRLRGGRRFIASSLLRLD